VTPCFPLVSDAAKPYSETILLSPADYVSFYKASYSILLHASALDGFKFAKVLALTGGEFDPAIMMTAKIHAKDGDRAKQVLASNSTNVPGDQTVNDILYVPGDGFACTCEGSLLENGTPDMLAPSSSKFPLLNVLSTSPRRAFVLHAAYLKLDILKKGEPWCDEWMVIPMRRLTRGS
jgi:hypothetical protein